MNYRLIPDALRPVAEKIEAQERVSDAEAVALLRHVRRQSYEIYADPGARYDSAVDQASETDEELFGGAVVVERSCVCEYKVLALRSDSRRGGAVEIEVIIAVENDLGLGATCGVAPMEVELHSIARKDDFVGVEYSLAFEPDLHGL